MTPLLATEKVPQPLAIDGVVVADVISRTLGVRLSEAASGYQRLWWRTAHTALRAAVEDGWARHSYVWASIPGAYQVAHVNPADFSMLTVHFPVGTAGFAELVNKPGLYAIAVVDRNSGRFTGVRFLNRP